MAHILTPARLKTLASQPLLGSNWYYIAAATFSVCNQPDAIPLIFEYMLASTPTASTAQHLLIARQIRESLLKGAALGGLPKTINSLTQLKHATPIELREPDNTPLRAQPDLRAQDADSRGEMFFDQVYGKISGRVKRQMSQAYPDLAHYALAHVYAPLLSYTGVLGPKETSFVVVACLVPQDVNPQLKGHLKGALNNGATKEEVMSVRDMSIMISKWCGVGWKSEVAKL